MYLCSACSFRVGQHKELVPFLGGKGGKEEDDSVAGLMRFLILHFPPVCNKLLPEGRGRVCMACAVFQVQAVSHVTALCCFHVIVLAIT